MGTIGNIAKHLYVVAFVAKVGRVLSDGAVVKVAALLQGVAYVLFIHHIAVRALEGPEFDSLAELGKGRGMGQGY